MSLTVPGAAKLLLAFVAGGAVTSLYMITNGPMVETPTELPSAARPLMTIFDESQPLFPAGERASKEEATARAGYEVVEPAWLPSPIVARSPEIWYAQDTNEAGIRYGSDLVLTFRLWPPGRDPAQTYEAQSMQSEAGSTTTLGDRPAWIIPADAQAPGAPPHNVIHMTRGNVDITLHGLVPLDDLIKVADSIP